MTSGSSSTDESERRWRIPPPVLGSAGVPGPEGLAVLEEIDGPVGEIVWRTLRSASTWVETPADCRAGLFPHDLAERRGAAILGPSVPAPLQEPLERLLEMLARPAAADPASAAEASLEVARWADEEGHGRTAALFFQLAANLCSGDPSYALSAARATRRGANYAGAEVWLQRAIGLSRRNGEWRLYVETFIAYGTMMRWRGNMPAARKHFERARRRARRQSYSDLEGKALHDLFVIEIECGRHRLAGEYALEALRAYPAGHPSLPRLAHDIAHFWMLNEKFRPALKVYQVVEPFISKEGKPVVWGGLALAAAGSGERPAFRSARERLAELPIGPGSADAWIEVAKGAHRLGDTDEALEAVDRALEIADERRERKAEFVAEALRTELVEARDWSDPDDVAKGGDVPDFADEVIRVLQSV